MFVWLKDFFNNCVPPLSKKGEPINKDAEYDRYERIAFVWAEGRVWMKRKS